MLIKHNIIKKKVLNAEKDGHSRAKAIDVYKRQLQYKIPSRMDIGHINVEFESSFEDAGPFGAKSIGEVVINTPLPAVTDALSHAAGKRFYAVSYTHLQQEPNMKALVYR